jgi:8-oxo-dGTP pyrophosphatase MutT (NUDIX family)
MAVKDEIVIIVDEHNRVVGTASRAAMRVQGLPHRATYILVFNSAGELFLHKRTLTKEVYPGYYDVVAGGVVLAGESYDEGAARELEEELGIAGVPLVPLFDFYHTEKTNRVWGFAYCCTWDGPIALQADEIESGAFRSVAAIFALAEKEPVTPDSLLVLKRYIEERGLPA